MTLFGEIIEPSGHTVEAITQSYYQGTKCTPSITPDITGYSPAPNGSEVTFFNTTSTTSSGPDFRVLAEKLTTGDILIVAEPTDDVAGTLHTLELVEIIVSALALVAATLLGWWLVPKGPAALDGNGADRRVDRRRRARRARARSQ